MLPNRLPPPDPTGPKKKVLKPKRGAKKFTPQLNGKQAVGPTETMPGPNRPDPKPVIPKTLGNNPNNGQYRIPGLGEYGKRKNLKKIDRGSPYFGKPDYGNRSV